MTGGGEALLFWILGPLSVLGALGLLFMRKAVHAALCMAFVMVNLGVMYLAQQADFLGVVQVFVYTGAVMMLFLFVLMLIGVDSADSVVETIRGHRIAYDRINEPRMAFDYYLRGHRGAGSSNIAEAGGFWRSPLATDERCDVQFHFVPAMLDDHGRRRLPGDGYTLHACFLRPRSRGRLTLASNRASDQPRIEANYLGDAEGFDLKVMLECAKVSRSIFAQRAFDPYRGAPIFPARNDLSDAELLEFIRAKAESVYHPVGTCRMGDDDDAVVDASLRVRGVEGLRVVDASVMPNLPGGNTNAPTIMIAERAADLIRAG